MPGRRNVWFDRDVWLPLLHSPAGTSAPARSLFRRVLIGLAVALAFIGIPIVFGLVVILIGFAPPL